MKAYRVLVDFLNNHIPIFISCNITLYLICEIIILSEACFFEKPQLCHVVLMLTLRVSTAAHPAFQEADTGLNGSFALTTVWGIIVIPVFQMAKYPSTERGKDWQVKSLAQRQGVLSSGYINGDAFVCKQPTAPIKAWTNTDVLAK